MFQGKTIGVIGDVMLDRFLGGNSIRLSPEAPVPVIRVTEESAVPGGAANVANNIAACGGTPDLIGVVGDDASGKELQALCGKFSGDVSGLVCTPLRPTTEKTRVMAQGKQVARVDREATEYLSFADAEKISNAVRSRVASWDAVIVSDYAKGVISEALIAYIIEDARSRNIPAIGDIKPVHIPFCKNITLLTSNMGEITSAGGTSDIEQAGRRIQKELGCVLLVTRGEEGMSLFDGDTLVHFSACAHRVSDVAGAGDTVTAIVALALASGMSYAEAACLANTAAGIVVGKRGVATVSFEELMNALDA